MFKTLKKDIRLNPQIATSHTRITKIRECKIVLFMKVFISLDISALYNVVEIFSVLRQVKNLVHVEAEKVLDFVR